jgi:hypothetical protein
MSCLSSPLKYPSLTRWDALRRMFQRAVRAHLIEPPIARLGLDKSDAHALVDAFVELIMQALESGETVGLSGFGCF